MTIRQIEPALRYERQHFREISDSGIDFGYPIDPRCTLAYARILDTTEILVAMNLGPEPKNDCITVDSDFTPTGQNMVDLPGTGKEVWIGQIRQRHAVKVSLVGHDIVILKRI
ncbi:MAG: hypothetical protein JSW39_19645 [Desulfobacterales bacterium]|nr:MAG: hypothetical protein JSW39_19645 [Desulfobacterales bacterium]